MAPPGLGNHNRASNRNPNDEGRRSLRINPYTSVLERNGSSSSSRPIREITDHDWNKVHDHIEGLLALSILFTSYRPFDPIQVCNQAHCVAFNGMGTCVSSELFAFLHGNVQEYVTTLTPDAPSKAKAAISTKLDLVFFLLHGAKVRV